MGSGEHPQGMAQIAWSLCLSLESRQDKNFQMLFKCCTLCGPKQYCLNDRMVLELQHSCSEVIPEIVT